MEQLQIHSKVGPLPSLPPPSRASYTPGLADPLQSYIVRWIQVAAAHSISWSLQPHKKSLNFGIFKHPGTKNVPASTLHTAATVEGPPTSAMATVDFGEGKKRRGSISRNELSTAVETLKAIGIKCVAWTGKCEADIVSMGTYDVPEGAGGMYGLVFDNTFSKTVSKSATFVLMTHPTNAPPKSGAQLPYPQGNRAGSTTSFTNGSPSLRPVDSNDSLPADMCLKPHIPAKLADGNFHMGIMHKKRRKRNQGWARRFFSLDFISATLSYYRNSHSSALRGAVPLSLAAIGVNEKSREFSIDSGAEVWHLKLHTKKDFDGWRNALERAASPATRPPSPVTPVTAHQGAPQSQLAEYPSEREWARVEELVSRAVGIRDAMRRLAQDTTPKSAAPSIAGISPAESGSNPFFQPEGEDRLSERLPFWKRKASVGAGAGMSSGMFRRSFSAQNAGASPPLSSYTSAPSQRAPSPLRIQTSGDDVHERCVALLHDLDSTVADFSALVAEGKGRRRPPLVASTSRMSLHSTSSQEFFDAEDHPSQLFAIRRASEDTKDDFADDSEASSDAGDATAEPAGIDKAAHTRSPLFPITPRPMVPTHAPIDHFRTSVPPPKQPPPSIIGFLRKNAGKDLSTVSMPVSANEPLSLVQKLAESVEAAHLLTIAASAPLAGPDKIADRLAYVAAFAISGFASSRVKERAIRKPFNPMLGETYELVRHEDATSSGKPGAYRFLAEKVSHHPVCMAWQADSLAGTWSISQSPQPVQKFWGKSVELNTDGKTRLVLHSQHAHESAEGECYSWTTATCFLRNVLAGEKYVEPVQSMTIVNESTGHKAIATFKAGGMFTGRSEEVTIALHAPGSSSALPLALTGKWTTGLARSDTGATIWEPGPLVPDAGKHYGFTAFAAALNQLDDKDVDVLPPTDSRLRPDQRALEEGLLDKAEGLKARLEERQRGRRKVLESHGREYEPRFFEKVEKSGEGEEVWRLKAGKDGYWECRERGDWGSVPTVFEM